MKRISKEILKTIIIENRDYISEIRNNFVERECFRLPGEIKKVIILYGVRRSGKTYLLYHLMQQNIDNAVYIDFEDDRLDGFSIEDFETLREAFFELYPKLVREKVYFLFDEIQIVDGWEKFCRRIVEKSQAEVIVAGSSSKIYPENISTTLRGRAWSIEVFPFSFREFIAYKGIKTFDSSLIIEERFRLMEYFNEYLKWGGFPEVTAAQSEFDKHKIVAEYLDAIFFKDLVERYEISNITLLNSLKNKIYATFGTKFSLLAFYNKIKGNFPVSKDLLYKYYQHLLDSKTVFEARKYSDSEYQKTKNPAKVYIIDSALAQKVVHDDTSRILENIVFIELLRQKFVPHYFSQVNECDFVISNDSKKTLIQVTYRLEDGNRERELNGIIEAAQNTHEKEAYILTFNESDEFIIDDIKIKVIPVWKWLLETTLVPGL